MRDEKKAALELSIGTIIIIVLALTMLILGIVLVRSIMCGAIGLTGELNSKVKKEIGKIFESSGGEVQCIGNGDEPVIVVPGKTNTIWCGIRADSKAKYKIEVVDIQSGNKNILPSATIRSWKTGPDSWTGEVSPGDETPKKFYRLNIPKDAPEVNFYIQVKVTKPETDFISEQNLDFKISRLGLVKAAMC